MSTNATPTYKQQARPFGFFLALIFFGVGGWLYFSGGHAGYWLGAAAVAVITAVFPRLWEPVLRIWMPVAHALGWINTRLLLGAVFFLMIVPMAWAVKLFRHDPLRLRSPRAGSEWIERKNEYTAASFKEPF